ncbi:hypothetical protein KKA47_01605 [bacterium]|nr:hypothetical protein [bacterium]
MTDVKDIKIFDPLSGEMISFVVNDNNEVVGVYDLGNEVSLPLDAFKEEIASINAICKPIYFQVAKLGTSIDTIKNNNFLSGCIKASVNSKGMSFEVEMLKHFIAVQENDNGEIIDAVDLVNKQSIALIDGQLLPEYAGYPITVVKSNEEMLALIDESETQPCKLVINEDNQIEFKEPAQQMADGAKEVYKPVEKTVGSDGAKVSPNAAVAKLDGKEGGSQGASKAEGFSFQKFISSLVDWSTGASGTAKAKSMSMDVIAVVAEPACIESQIISGIKAFFTKVGGEKENVITICLPDGISGSAKEIKVEVTGERLALLRSSDPKVAQGELAKIVAECLNGKTQEAIIKNIAVAGANNVQTTSNTSEILGAPKSAPVVKVVESVGVDKGSKGDIKKTPKKGGSVSFNQIIRSVRERASSAAIFPFALVEEAENNDPALLAEYAMRMGMFFLPTDVQKKMAGLLDNHDSDVGDEGEVLIASVENNPQSGGDENPHGDQDNQA